MYQVFNILESVVVVPTKQLSSSYPSLHIPDPLIDTIWGNYYMISNRQGFVKLLPVSHKQSWNCSYYCY